MKKSVCQNCNREFEGRYCPDCGQEYGSTRLTRSSLIGQLTSIFVGDCILGEHGATIHRYGILQTLWRLIAHPATTIGDYLAGRQRRYFDPVALLLLMCGTCVLTLHTLGIELILTGTETSDEFFLPEHVFNLFFDYANSHFEIIALLQIPAMAVAFKWIFHHRSQFSFMEYCYIGIFLYSLYIALTTVTAIVKSASGIAPDSAWDILISSGGRILLVIYNTILFRSLLRIGWTRAFFGSLAAAILSTLLILAFLLIIIILLASASEIFG